MDDLISRQAAIDAVMKYGKQIPTFAIAVKDALENLPSVQPETNCSEIPNNSDLISRQAAIDAIVNTVSEIGNHDNSEVARYRATFRQHEILDIIESLPSVQPEQELLKDGTLVVKTNSDMTKFDRVNVIQNGTHYGDLFYQDDDTRRKGKWVLDNPHSEIYKYACSECHAHHRARYDFCPSCGADMRSEAREYLEYGKLIAKGIEQGLRGDSDEVN